MDGLSEDDDECSPSCLRALVGEHQPIDERENESKVRFLSELESLARPCSKGAGPVHVTASGVIVGPRGTVLHRHRRLGRWMQPGGHIEPGEAPSAGALRECEEETGLSLRHPPGGPLLVHVDVHPAASGHTHLDLRYLLVGSDADPEPPAGESPDARWYGWDEASAIADASLEGGLRAARAAWERMGPASPRATVVVAARGAARDEPHDQP